VIDLSTGLAEAPEEDTLARTAIAHRAVNLLRPPGALQRLDEIASWLGAWQRTDTPAVEAPVLLLAAGDHGVAGRHVSVLRPEFTVATIDAIRAGASTSTVLTESLGASLRLVDLGAGRPTGDIVTEDAMPVERFESAFEEGRDAVATLSTDLLMLGDLGVGATTAAAALCSSLFGGEAVEWVGRGSGIDDDGLERKVEAVAAAAERVGDVGPLEALRRLGGVEMAALTGAVYEARVRSIPVVLDGLVATASAAVLESLLSGALDHTLAGHRSTEPGHARLLTVLSKQPVVDVDVAMGEGTGALLALPIIRAAALAVSDVATVDEWGLR
jgi:nicotinate-nucleotide--dimethylbenzimidazole phosphoribosyltransferase